MYKNLGFHIFTPYFHSMETNNTNILQPGDILSVKEVQELMPPSITKGWLYSHWEEIGGVVIANKKLILRENLYAYIKGEKREVLRKGVGQQSSVHSIKNGDESNQLVEQNQSQSCRSRIEKTDTGPIFDHSDEFGLTESL